MSSRLAILLALAPLAAPVFAQEPVAGPEAAVSPAAELPGYAFARDEEGFLSLFNGKDLTGWSPKIRGFAFGENFANTFRVADGVIQVRYDGYEAFDGRFGHLFHEAEFSSYVLRFEYRFVGEQVEGGPGWAFRNSGVMLHGQDPRSMGKDQDFPVSIETQLLGGNGKDPRTTMNLCTPGTNVVMDEKLVRRHCTNSRSETYHGDRWVAVEVEVHAGEQVIHKVDGKVVLSYEKPQLDPGDGDAKKLIEARDGVLLLEKGTISFQSESHPCDFRNIRIKPLEVPEADRDGAPQQAAAAAETGPGRRGT